LNPLPAAAEPLAELRGYHLPEAVSWWPPAPGWWVLLGVVLLSGALALWWGLRRRRCHAAARQAVRELQILRTALAARRDHAEFVRGLSRLLRRYVLAAFPRHRVAALTGDDWLAFLDTHGGDGRFRDGPGRQLVEAPYRPAAEVAAEDLAALVADWIRRNREVCR
jgi:hypothetical protein